MSSESFYQVTDSNAIRGYFNWHERHGVSVSLMVASVAGLLHASLSGFDAKDRNLIVTCDELRLGDNMDSAYYALVGTAPNGASFLASGKLQVMADSSSTFKLSFPESIDISQFRDSYRCPTPSAHFLHFSSPNPHVSDLIGRVRNVSLGGIAVELDRKESQWEPQPDDLTDHALLVSGNANLALGKLRVTHTTKYKKHWVIGMQLEKEASRQYGALVLDAQRSQPGV